MDHLLLEKCNIFIERKEALQKEFIFSDSEVNAVIAFIFMCREREIDFEALKICEWAIKQRFSWFSPYRQYLMKVYAALIVVSGEEPDEVISRVMSFETVFNRSFKDTPGLSALAFAGADRKQVEYPALYYRALAIFNQMKDLHRILTNDQDVVYAGILAMTPHLKEDIVDELIIMDEMLKDEFRLENDYARKLSYVLAMCDGTAVAKVERAMDFILRISGGWDRSINYLYFILPALLANLTVPIDTVYADYTEVKDFLSREKGYGVFSGNAKDLHACMILANYYIGDQPEVYTLINAIVMTILQIRAAAVAASV